jgi:peptidoglycan/xylan/chitin deacetylase (PgdA/CDA1 family)
MRANILQRGRAVCRSAALSLGYMSQSPSGRIEAGLSIGRVQLTLLHEVPPGQERAMESLVDFLAGRFAMVSYSEAVDRIGSGRLDRPYASITFDDGLYSSLTAARIMAERGIKGCFFLCPAALGARPGVEHDRFCEARLLRPPVPLLSWNDAEELLLLGHEIGAHTVTHADLGSVPQDVIQHEIQGSKEALERRFGAIRHFSWPFGELRNISDFALKFAFQSGFVSCASARRGCYVAAGNLNTGLWRDNLMVEWPREHMMFFFARNAVRAASHQA